MSRLPGFQGGADILLLSGFHGAGTQAAELLFDPKAFSDMALARLIKALKDARYWQFVLEVGNIEHFKPMTEGHSIRVSERCPPKKIELPTPSGYLSAT